MTICRPTITGLVLQRRGTRQNLFSLGPCPFLGVGKNRTDGQTKPRGGSSIFRSGSPHPRRDVANLRVGLAPKREGVGVFGGDLDRSIGPAADKRVDAAGLIRLDLRKPLLNFVVLAVVVERLFAGPFGTDNVEELIGARVTLILVINRVAVLPQLRSIAPGDDMK